MLPLCTIVTDSRLWSSAYWMAARMRRFDPMGEIGLMPMPESSRMGQPISVRRYSASFSASGVPDCTS